MFNKKSTACLLGMLLIAACGYFCFSDEQEEPEIVQQKVPEKTDNPRTMIKKAELPKPVKVEKHDLYSTADLPLQAIVEISKLPHTSKEIADNILEESQGFYLLKTESNNGFFAILETPINDVKTYPRHNLEFAKVSELGEVNFEDLDKISENESDKWKFDKSETPRPLKHIIYDEKGKVKFTEIWNYDDNEPVKYELRNSENKPVSILKETLEGDTNYRKEHIFYDENGNTKKKFSINYDGANISRLTYFDSENMEDSITIISEYSGNGVKTKESVYNSNYELVNTIVSDYEDNERKSIQVLDKDGKEIKMLN